MLGAYRRTLVMTRNGRLWTNALNRSYLFDIGEKAADVTIDFIEAHFSKDECEPYQNAVSGRVADVADGRLVVRSSGATYIVSLGDLRISRYIDSSFVRTGDAVQVVFEGEIDEDGTISGAASLARAALSPEDEAD